VPVVAFIPLESASEAVGDPSATRTVYVTTILLVVLALALAALAVWLYRRTRPEPELFAPLEVMETRSWRKMDGEARQRTLDAVRPDGALPAAREELGSPEPGGIHDPERPDDEVVNAETELPAEVDDEATVDVDSDDDPTPKHLPGLPVDETVLDDAGIEQDGAEVSVEVDSVEDRVEEGHPRTLEVESQIEPEVETEESEVEVETLDDRAGSR
jgi:hypothetical protein